MVPDQLKVAMAGAGMVTRHHLIAWSRVAGAKVVAIQNRTLEKAQTRAAEFGVLKVYSDLKEMLDREKPDVLDIAAAMEVHAEIARIAADFGVDILCQKPMTPTLSESEALVSEIGDRVRFMVHENWRFRPQYRQAAAWIAAGRTGLIREFHLSARSSGLVTRNQNNTAFDLAHQPFLARMQRLMIMEMLIHHLDTLRNLVGPMEVIGCQTMRISSEVAGEDAAIITLKATNGGFGTVCGNMSAPGFPAESHDRLEIIGEKASIMFEGDRLRLVGEEEETIRIDLTDAYQKAYDNAIAHFAEALRSGSPFETDCRDNLQTLKLVDEAYRKAGL